MTGKPGFTYGHRGLRRALKKLPIVARAEWSTLAAIVAGSIIYAYGVMAFTIPFRFPDAGVTGIAALLNYTMGIPLPVVVGVANLALLAWAWRGLSPRVALWTAFSVILLTILMRLMDDIPFAHTDQRLLIALIGGAIKGYGIGLVFRAGVTLGGLDMIVLYLQKKYGIEVGKYSFYINMCIIGASAYFVGVENAMLGLVGVYASSLTIDNTISSFDRRRLIFVVTKHPDPVVRHVTTELGRGATILDAHGGYSGETRPVVMCLLTRRQAVELRRFLAENQPNAFMVVSEASEVVGRGFKPWRSR